MIWSMQSILQEGICNSYPMRGGMLCIPIFGMLGVSWETTPFWYEIHTFVLTV